MSDATWETAFKAVYDRGMAAWTAGRRNAASMFSKDDVQFLAGIGCTAQELFDFVDDAHRYGAPDYETTLGITRIRRRYFLEVMNGRPTGRVSDMSLLPPKPLAVDGIPWLPRAIAKARIKLRGEMPDELMYCCGGDREFFGRIRMTAPAFLQLVWDSGDDDRKIIDTVKKTAGRH